MELERESHKKRQRTFRRPTTLHRNLGKLCRVLMCRFCESLEDFQFLLLCKLWNVLQENQACQMNCSHKSKQILQYQRNKIGRKRRRQIQFLLEYSVALALRCLKGMVLVLIVRMSCLRFPKYFLLNQEKSHASQLHSIP